MKQIRSQNQIEKQKNFIKEIKEREKGIDKKGFSKYWLRTKCISE